MNITIKELTKLDPAETEQVFAEVATALLPNPGLTPQPARTDSANRVITALRAQFDKKGVPAESEVFGFLADRLSRKYLTEEKIPQIRARLGESGVLPAHLYKVVYHSSFDQNISHKFLRRSHVEDAIYHSDAVQHFTPSQYGMEAGRFPSMSLYVKHQKNRSSGDFTLLIHCIHQGDELVVGRAFRVYRDDIEEPTDLSPLALLRAFLKAYGAKFSVEGCPYVDFMLYEVFPIERPTDGVALRFEGGLDGYISHHALIRVSHLMTVEVVFAFFVRMDLYCNDLVKHGVPVDLSEQAVNEITNSGDTMWLKL